MRKVMSFLLTFILMIGMVSGVYAESNSTAPSSDGKAKILNQLDILRGDGVDYKLGSQLKRSEAAAFIVRFVGKDKEVMDNKATYVMYGFDDVNAYDWFAPYVGYCSKAGIINGFEDGTFKPDDYVSEKAFLKMLLTSVGYTYEKDFIWDTVYQSAYNLKVVADESYVNKKNDNTNYLRSLVVDALYNGLKIKQKTTKEKMIEYFIKANKMTAEEAGEAGIIDYDKPTAIETFEMTQGNALEVTFNEDIKSLTPSNIKVANLENNKEVSISHVVDPEYGDKYKIVLNQNLLPDRQYKIEFENVVDTKGNTAPTMIKLFTGIRGIEIESNQFIISKVEQKSSNTLYLYFTHPVNDNILIPNLFSVSENGVTVTGVQKNDISVGLLNSNVNAVILTLNNYSLKAEHEYRLNVAGKAISTYGVDLNDGKGDFVNFKASALNASEFELLSIKASKTNVIELEFGREVNTKIAEQVFSYYLTDYNNNPMRLTKANVLSNGTTVLLTTENIMVNAAPYKLMINQAYDVSRENSIIEKSYDFTVLYEVFNDIKIEKVEPVDQVSIEVTLSKALDHESAVAVTNYQIVSNYYNYAYNPAVVYHDPVNSPNKIKLFLNEHQKLVNTYEYEFRLMATLLDENGNGQTKTIAKRFINDKYMTDWTHVEKAIVVGDNTVKLVFNKEIALDVPNVLQTNYTLEYEENGGIKTKTPISATYIDAKTMVLKFNYLDPNIIYKVNFGELTDYAGNVTNNQNGIYKTQITWE